jgi:hypothetical protein
VNLRENGKVMTCGEKDESIACQFQSVRAKAECGWTLAMDGALIKEYCLNDHSRKTAADHVTRPETRPNHSNNGRLVMCSRFWCDCCYLGARLKREYARCGNKVHTIGSDGNIDMAGSVRRGYTTDTARV